ncbi:MAG: hypothetical protein LBM02_04685 [Lachnospiraceae bacterium]|jgi:hypothetical protein|nr:hypothetical protein [Lachnospiraceae bacterium]
MELIQKIQDSFQDIYAQYTKWIDRIVQFIIALITFLMVNHMVGYMKLIDSPLVSIILAIVATVLPMAAIPIIATVLVLLNLFSLSYVYMAIVAIVFLIIYIFYFRLSDTKAVYLVLVPIAFLLNIPFAIPVAFALVGEISYIIPMLLGTFIFYMLKGIGPDLKSTTSANEMINQSSGFIKGIFQNKAMIIMIISVLIVFVVVSVIKKMAIKNAWKIATVSGVVVGFIVAVLGNAVFKAKISFIMLILGSIFGILIGLILELKLFKLNYAKSISLEFEDDSYVYYVKAIPRFLDEKSKNKNSKNKEESLDDTIYWDKNKLSEENEEVADNKVKKPGVRPKSKKTYNSRNKEKANQLKSTKNLSSDEVNRLFQKHLEETAKIHLKDKK